MYDDTILRKRIQDMNEMMDGLNFFYLIFRLRGGLARDQYGMQHGMVRIRFDSLSTIDRC